MVDFRYHIVSIVAIFLALAIGIVLGAGPLKTTSDAGLKTQVSDLRQARNTLQGNLDTAQSEITFLNSFGTQVAPGLLAGRLAGFDVAVVVLPGASSSLTAGLLTALAQSGAVVSVQARIGSNWTDPDMQAELTAALAAGRPTATPSTSAAAPVPGTAPAPSSGASGTAGSASPTPTVDPSLYVDAGVDLARAILSSSTPAAVPTSSPAASSPVPRPATSSSPAGRLSRSAAERPSARPSAAVSRSPAANPLTAAAIAARTLSALVAGGFVTLGGAVPHRHPTLALVVAADPPQNVDAGAVTAASELLALAEGLRGGSDGTVVAGDAAAAGNGGLLSLIRASKPTAGGLSTVDSTDTPVGRIAVPLALVEQQSAGKVGQYGQVGHTDGALPQVAGIGSG